MRISIPFFDVYIEKNLEGRSIYLWFTFLLSRVVICVGFILRLVLTKRNLCVALYLYIAYKRLPSTHSPVSSYTYINKNKIYEELHFETVQNFNDSEQDCEYRELLFNDTTLSARLKDEELAEYEGLSEGGDYVPPSCNPRFSTAIIVPYRAREKHLRQFLSYMHKFLRLQHIHFRIFVVEQVDSLPFNRAKLLNVGAAAALRAGFPCLVLHDVDLLPLRPANLYACTRSPRHMSASIDRFRFLLPYKNYFGGVTSILGKQFESMNGMSNQYYGWGGEDDDFYLRMYPLKLHLCRYEPATSRYYSLRHRRRGGANTRISRKIAVALLSETLQAMGKDGLNTLTYNKVSTTLRQLYTHIEVDFSHYIFITGFNLNQEISTNNHTAMTKVKNYGR